MWNPGHVNKRSGGMWNAKSGSSGILIHIPEWISEEPLIEAGTAGDSYGRMRKPGQEDPQ